MLRIHEWTFERLKERFSEKEIKLHSKPKSRQTSRYIQIYIPQQDKNLHYEYLIDPNWDGRIELHFEGDWINSSIIDELMDYTQHNEQLSWSEWMDGYRCQLKRKIDILQDLLDGFEYMMEVFDNRIKEITSEQTPLEPVLLSTIDLASEQTASVNIHTWTLKQLLSHQLSIPNYQRIYCWEEHHVKSLLDDVFEHLENTKKLSVTYRLGTVILHAHDGQYDIVDGQQRLITLSLLLSEIGVLPSLLNEKLSSKQSLEYVAYNKFYINKYLQQNPRISGLRDRLLEIIDFSVLVLKNASLDLAYTFFSNQNSRGVRLTDYDLLKAHHLRYISHEKQSMLVAEVWNKMIENGRAGQDSSDGVDYEVTLDKYIYRLRNWMRKRECDDSIDQYRIKREYEAAPIIDELPPFGEQFYFNEPIQGGTHFFSFVERHLEKYQSFIQTDEYQKLHGRMSNNRMSRGSHRWYRDVIESHLFGYYLKFGTCYLAEALVVIMRIILQHRYLNRRVRKAAIVQYAGDTELIMIIDQATSPTFFLGEARRAVKELAYPSRKSMTPIMRKMKGIAGTISIEMEQNLVVESFKNLNR
jgi:hypothetical protein